MDTKPLKIGYGGVLSLYNKLPEKRSSWKNWIWTYWADNIDFRTRSPRVLFKALELLRKEDLVSDQDILVHLWGNIEPEIKDFAKQLGIDDLVIIEGFKQKSESQKMLLECEILFLPLESSKHGQKPLFIPGKIFEYLGMRKPILILSEDSDCRDIAIESGMGICFEPDDIKGVSGFLKEACKNREILKEFKPDEDFIESFKFEKKAKQLASIFDELLT